VPLLRSFQAAEYHLKFPKTEHTCYNNWEQILPSRHNPGEKHMSPQTQILIFEKLVQAPPQIVFEAFTNATSLREWFCDVATVDPKPGGRLYLAWNSGFYAAGEYSELQKNEKVAFTWHGRGEPAPSIVEIQLKSQDGATQIHLEHQEVGSGPEWESTIVEAKEGWTSSLENLASVLEKGEDQRFVRRPMLGITISDFNAEIANQLGIPVSKGIRIDSTIEGLGARAAGLQGNDVIVRMDDQETTDFASLGSVLQRHLAGDKVEVVFFRGAEKKSILMELSRRPLPEVPPSIPELAEFYRERQNEIQQELDEFFRGVTEKEASFKPGPDEWGVKEVLAHLIQGERYLQIWMTELLGREEAHHDEWPGNLQAPIDATVTAFPTLSDLRQEYKCSGQETVALIASFPEDFQQYKGSYWRMAYNLVEDPYHHRNHLEQMRAAIDAARKG
jgi:uncharacterized protein YndB with AHSA1/START domain